MRRWRGPLGQELAEALDTAVRAEQKVAEREQVVAHLREAFEELRSSNEALLALVQEQAWTIACLEEGNQRLQRRCEVAELEADLRRS